MRITKVYTRTGDKGSTSLANGQRVEKFHPRLQAYGTVDELNAALGWCIAELDAIPDAHAWTERLILPLESVQHDLFNIGSDLATPVESRFPKMVLVSDQEPQVLENLMDALSEELPPLNEFVLPGGSRISAVFHLARTICRRAEREATQLAETTEINQFCLIYLNRLSDYLFVAGRFCQKQLALPEVTWNSGGGLAHFAQPE